MLKKKRLSFYILTECTLRRDEKQKTSETRTRRRHNNISVCAHQTSPRV